MMCQNWLNRHPDIQTGFWFLQCMKRTVSSLKYIIERADQCTDKTFIYIDYTTYRESKCMGLGLKALILI